jgi:hypothetical protein
MTVRMRRAANDKVWVIGKPESKKGFMVSKVVWGYDEPPWKVVRPPDEVREAAILVGPAKKV